MSIKSHEKKGRMLDIFYRAMRGEKISVRQISEEYQVSTKSISRDINEIKNFLCEHREAVGHTELMYDASEQIYYLNLDGFLLSKEMLAVIKILIGSRGLEKDALEEIIAKLKRFMSFQDQKLIQKIVEKEMFHYQGVHHDCPQVIDGLWKLTRCIQEKTAITISYYKMNRTRVERKIKPVSLIFSEYYFYLIAYRCNTEEDTPAYFRTDRICSVIEHREHFVLPAGRTFDEGELRQKIHFMFPGREQKIKFEFSGPSLQAVLDKIPTAKVTASNGRTHTVEAVTFGDGIKMYLLSQGSWVKVLEPPRLVQEMREEIEQMQRFYKDK